MKIIKNFPELMKDVKLRLKKKKEKRKNPKKS